MDVDSPANRHEFETEGPGDYENIEYLRYFHAFCENITSIKCARADDGVSWHLTDDINLTCNTKTGFKCFNEDQYDSMCDNYHVQVYCYCQGEPIFILTFLCGILLGYD